MTKICKKETAARWNICQKKQLQDKSVMQRPWLNHCELNNVSELARAPCLQRSWSFNNNLVCGCRFNILPGPEHEGWVHVDRGHSSNMANFFGDHPQLLKVYQAVHFRIIPWWVQSKWKMKNNSFHTAQMAKLTENRKPDIHKARIRVRFKSGVMLQGITNCFSLASSGVYILWFRLYVIAYYCLFIVLYE